MIDGLKTYSIGNFIPFQSESYFRLFERQTESLWPLHLLLLALGIAAIVLACRFNTRATAVILAAALVVSAATFHFQLYAELTPVGGIFGKVFLAQAVLVLTWGFLSRREVPSKRDIGKWSGLVLAWSGVVIYPMLVGFGGKNRSAAEWFGLAPDPTICATLGLLLVLARPLWLLLLLPLPLLWCAVSGATLRALEAPLAALLPAAASFALLAAIAKGFLHRKSSVCRKENASADGQDEDGS